MNDRRYLGEKFLAGVHILAEGRESLKDRLRDACKGPIHTSWDAKQMAADVPDASKKRIDAFRGRMTSRGSIEATVDRMGDEEAAECAAEIVYIAWDMKG